METIIFLRYLLPTLVDFPEILKSLQKLLKQASYHSSSEKQKESVSHAIGETIEESRFIQSVNLFYRSILEGPLSFGMEFKGLNKDEQDESYHNMLNVIRSELNKLSKVYGDGFEAIFTIVKGKKDSPSLNIIFASEGMTDWMLEREKEIEKENKLLKEAVEQLRKQVEILRKKVTVTSDHLNKSE